MLGRTKGEANHGCRLQESRTNGKGGNGIDGRARVPPFSFAIALRARPADSAKG